MAKLEIRKSSAQRLRPPSSAITDGSPDPVPVAFRLGDGFGPLTLHVDRASLRRFTVHQWLSWAGPITAVGITLFLGIWYGKSDALAADGLTRFVLLAVTIPWLIAAIYLSYLAPKARPRTQRNWDKVKLRDVDESAAAQWQSANDDGLITIVPDTPTRDMLARHMPPMVFGLVVMAVALLA